MRFFKYILVLFVILFIKELFGVTINITVPQGTEKLKRINFLTIMWTADWTGDPRTLSVWEIYYSSTGNGTPNNPTTPGEGWSFLGYGGNNPAGGNYDMVIPNDNTSTATIYIYAYCTDNSRTGQKSLSFTIDNTPPTSNLGISYSGKIQVGEEVTYSGDFEEDLLSPPIEIVSAKIIANNEDNPDTADEICDITPPTISYLNSSSGTYSGGFTLTEDIVNAIRNYAYVWVRVIVQDQAEDQNGEGNRVVDDLLLSEQISVSISGYVEDYKGNNLANIPVILGGDLNLNTTTNSTGYYEFNVTGYYFESSNTTYIGYYYIFPSIQCAVPSHRIYDSVYKEYKDSLTDEDFIVENGWRFKEYDLGNSNEYYFKTEGTLFTPYQLLLDWQIEKGGDILTGDIDNDGKLDLLIKWGNELSCYYYSGGYLSKFGISVPSYFLGILDEYDQEDTGYLEILLTGTGQNALKIYDNTGSTTPLHTITISDAPTDTKWSARMTGYKKVLLAGSGTNYNKIILYDCDTDSVIWEKNITDITIEPDKINIVEREDSKVMVVFGGTSSTTDLKVYAIDLFTGEEIWTKTFSGKRGKIRTIVSPISSVLYGDIIGILSDALNSNNLSVYRLSRDGSILSEIPLNISSSEFRYAVSDVDVEGVKELIITDNNENLYVIDFSTSNIESQLSNAGKLWACADFDGDNKKEIIVSQSGTVKVLQLDSNKNIQTITSYNLNDSINKLIVSDINNDGFLEIIATSPTRTYVLRPMKSGENLEYSALPSLPRPSLSVSVDYEEDGAYNGIYLRWTYNLSDDPRLVGFKIERSEDGVVWDTLVVNKTISEWNAGFDRGGREYDSGTGTYYYWYKDYPPHPYVGETYTYYYRVIAYNNVSNVYSTSSWVSFYSGGISTGGGGCFIASACFGENSWQVKILREFRDRFLVKNEIGRRFVKFYYAHSPSIADYLRRHYLLTIPVKLILYLILFIVFLALSGILPYLVFTGCLYYLFKKLKS